MKIILTKILVIGLIFSSCQNSAPQNENPQENENAEETQEEIYCDSTFADLLELLKLDSVRNYKGQYYNLWDFNYVELLNDSIINHKVKIVSKFHDSISSNRIWTELQLDTIYNIEQLRKYETQDLHIETNCLTTYEFISPDSLKSFYEEESKSNSNKTIKHFSFSKPLISENGKYALLELEYHCGLMCASAYTYLFEKIDGTWKFCWRYCRWVA